MKKINLFFILATKEQTYNFEKNVSLLHKIENIGRKVVPSFLELHYLMLSKHFNLFNFYKYQDSISTFDTPMIYHLPNGIDDDKEIVETILLNLKGKIPIVYRSYDPHSPLKMSIDYMTKYHDLIITYVNKYANNENIRFAQICYDSHLFYEIEKYKLPEKQICMILRNRTSTSHRINHEEFLKIGLNLKKTYHEREMVVKFETLDVFGQGWDKNMKNYKGPISPNLKKYEMLSDYKFSLVIENAIVETYLSPGKILDAMLTYTVPVYLGSNTAENYIPKSCFININNFKNYNKLFEYIETISIQEYEEYIFNINKHRDQILSKFTTQNSFSEHVYDWYNKKYNTELGPSQKEYSEFETDIKKLKILKENSLRYKFVKFLNI